MKHIVTILALILSASSIYAQLDTVLKNVIVEKYYVSDANDARDIQYYTNDDGDITDTVILAEGSVTYRIFIQLANGYKLRKVYGNSNHTLKILSDSGFYNNADYGASFGVEISGNNVKKKTTALDTWLTLGQATDKNYGIQKTEDTDGSVLGLKGYLLNNDTAAGIPLTVSDGLDNNHVVLPRTFESFGIVDTSGYDSTIFGSLKVRNQFISNNAFIQIEGGIMGVKPDSSNKVLIAQLTTRGNIKFELNIMVLDNKDDSIFFVAKNSIDSAQGNIFKSYLLSYPPIKPLPKCECNDPDYLEFKQKRECDDSTKCQTRIIYGCMDPYACNFDPNANVDLQELCCYPGLCANRDISEVCPDLGKVKQVEVNIYPNPVNDKLGIEVSNFNSDKAFVSIYNVYGNELFENMINTSAANKIDVSSFVNGVYILHIQTSEGLNIIRYFIKN